jgi:triacylglycerol esterase/lipase EstA (alpha/beta hydrolase family)
MSMSVSVRTRSRLLATVSGLVLAVGGAVAANAAAEPPPPPGANLPFCLPSPQHPRPVVLVHGTFENRSDNWQALSADLALQGYCVYALDYGANLYSAGTFYGLAHVASSAGELSTFIQGVLAQTHATQVDVVGHSQGGMMPRYYLGFLGGAPYVHTLVGLAPSNHGTTLDGLATLAHESGFDEALASGACDSCLDQEAGSPFMTQLNSIGDTLPGVTYTVIETRYDEVVTPYTSAFLTGSAVTNITVQDQCATDTSDHLQLPYDPVALHDVTNALDPTHATPVSCG